MVLKMTISKAWAMDFVWSSVGNFLLYAKFSLSGGIQHGALKINFLCEFSNAHGWVDAVEFEVEAGTGLGVHDAHWPSGWEVCTGDPDGTSCLPNI